MFGVYVLGGLYTLCITVSDPVDRFLRTGLSGSIKLHHTMGALHAHGSYTYITVDAFISDFLYDPDVEYILGKLTSISSSTL